MTATVLTSLRNFKGLLFILPFLALPLVTFAPAMTTPAISKQGAGLVLFVSLQRSAMR